MINVLAVHWARVVTGCIGTDKQQTLSGKPVF